jgi:hypothetical protein
MIKEIIRETKRRISGSAFIASGEGIPLKSGHTAAKASTETTSIENNWMVATTNTSSSDWFIDCGCRIQLSGG